MRGITMLEDLDPAETREWLEALDSVLSYGVVQGHGPCVLPSHHRTCGPASGGSSSRRIETLAGLAQGLQAEAVPIGIGQVHLKDLGARNPPVPLAATAPFAGVALGDTAYPQVVPLGGGGLPFLPADLPQAAA